MNSMDRSVWIFSFIFIEGWVTWFLYATNSFKEPLSKKSGSAENLDWYWQEILCAAPLNLWALWTFFVPLGSIMKGKGFALADLIIILLMFSWVLIVILLQFPTRLRVIFFKDPPYKKDDN